MVRRRSPHYTPSLYTICVHPRNPRLHSSPLFSYGSALLRATETHLTSSLSIGCAQISSPRRGGGLFLCSNFQTFKQATFKRSLNSFRMRTYKQTPRFARFWPKLPSRNSFRIRTYRNHVCKPFRMRSSKKSRGRGGYVTMSFPFSNFDFRVSGFPPGNSMRSSISLANSFSVSVTMVSRSTPWG